LKTAGDYVMFSSENIMVLKDMPNNRLQSDDTKNDLTANTQIHTEGRSNQLIWIGAPDWVNGVIQRLHSAQIVEIRDWSRLMPTRNADEVISLVQRPREVVK
jgi:hypothetical protein